MNYAKLREEQLKSAVREDFFANYKYTQLGNIDFVIAKHNTLGESTDLFEDDIGDLKSILWAEAKQGTSHDIYESFVQLLLTIGKERTFEHNLPPKYIGAFDAEKFAFIEYHGIQEIFYQNDFNWNVTPSNHDTKEFHQLHDLCKKQLEENSILFYFKSATPELQKFIRLNFKTAKDVSEKISVTKNNFTFVFQKWEATVKPSINVDWAKVNKNGIISADFFLADLLSDGDKSIKDNLFVVLKRTKYELAKKLDENGFLSYSTVEFKDKQKAYKEFWSIYKRPPQEEYWDYIIGRRDLLVPQDIRERKGSFFTPQIWVEKSQQYLADVLGETWQDEYYIWDCCAGTGNLENGLTNYDNVWVSTLDKQDIDVMKERVNNGWPMPENHIFQFDFLNDDFLSEHPEAVSCHSEQSAKHGVEGSKGKIPDELYQIINDPEKRKKLVIYINPPYAEAATTRTISGTGENKTNVAVTQKTYQKYLDKIGIAGRELFAQFFIRIYLEINGCILAEFSKLKMIQSPNFKNFRNIFKAKLEKLFVVPANTFDNVKGAFPIGFFVWNTNRECHTDLFTANAVHDETRKPLGLSQSVWQKFEADVYDAKGTFQQKREYVSITDERTINDWIISTRNRLNETPIGYMSAKGADFQNNAYNYIVNDKSQLPHPRGTLVTTKNIIEICVYMSVRQCIPQTWLNDRDQFLYPNDGWQDDKSFQLDCLIYTLFHGQNRISTSTQTTNHWIPFTREEVGCKSTFKSNFMNKFIKSFLCEMPMSSAAKAVYDAGLELWRYYHAQKGALPDASFYDIRKHFQGVDCKGHMKSDSEDSTYMDLIATLRTRQKALAKQIEVKVYQYGFLK